MKKRRVLIIHQHDPAINHVGGVGTYINTFIKYAPQDFEVSLIGVTADPSARPVGQWQKYPLNGNGRTFDYLPIVDAHPTYHYRFPLSIRFTWALWQNRAKINFKDAILELHRIEPELALGGVKESKVCFFHTHTQDLYNPKTEIFWKKAPWLYFMIEKPLLGRMDHLFSVREDLVKWYNDRYPNLGKPHGFVPTWVDEDVFKSLPEAERRQCREELGKAHNLDIAPKWLLFVGRFELQKDPELLLKSFKELLKKKDCRLVMIGGGSLETMIRSFIAEKGLEKKVLILGPTKQTEIAKWMNASDLLVLTSAYEGMPRVVVESLQCGLSAVAFDEGEAKRVIASREAGRVVNQRTPEAFSSAFAEVLDQTPDRKACQKSVEPYSAAKILEKLFESYRQLKGGQK